MKLIKNFAFLVILPLILISFNYNAKATDNIYEVDNVQVNSSAATPADARDLAIIKAQKNGFEILLNRLGIDAAIVNDCSSDEISDLVRSRQIIDENIAGNSYSAVFNLVFAKDFVDNLLLRKNISHLSPKSKNQASNQNDSALLIPIKNLKAGSLLWENNNDWKGTLERILQDQLNTKLKIPTGDLSDIATIDVTGVANYNYTTFKPILDKYHASFVYLAYFDYDSIENKAIITLKTIRQFQNKEVKLNLVNTEILDYANFLDKTATRTIEYLLNPQNFDSDSILSNQPPVSNTIDLTIMVSSVDEWLVAKNRIEASNLVNQMEIKSILRTKVNISVNYIAKNPDIISAFAKVGLFGIKGSDNSYILSLKPLIK